MGNKLLILVVGIQVLEHAWGVIEDFLGLEESIQFDDSVLRRVGCVDDVFLETHTEVATDGAWSCLARVGAASHRSNSLDSVNAFIATAHNRRSHH